MLEIEMVVGKCFFCGDNGVIMRVSTEDHLKPICPKCLKVILEKTDNKCY